MKIVKLAEEFQTVLIPFGGGTSVSGALSAPENEIRSIVSVDTSQMVRSIIAIFSYRLFVLCSVFDNRIKYCTAVLLLLRPEAQEGNSYIRGKKSDDSKKKRSLD